MISVIMPSFIGNYSGAATDRENKLKRAVESFLSQDITEKELMLVSDGCAKTINCYYKYWLNKKEVRLITLNKQPLFSGNVRNKGIEHCTGNIITYLDSDDMFGTNTHLSNIVKEFTEEIQWVYFDDYIKYFHTEHIKPVKRDVKVTQGLIGTSNIAHISNSMISWNGCNGYGHDWLFIERLIKFFPKYKKIYGTNYTVCHIPNSVDV